MKFKYGRSVDNFTCHGIVKKLFFFTAEKKNEFPEVTDAGDLFVYYIYPDWVERFADYLKETWLQKFLDFVNDKFRDKTIKLKVEDHDAVFTSHIISLIALPLLYNLKEYGYGIPSKFCDKRDPDVYPTDTTEEKYRGISAKKWGEAVDKMIWSLEQVKYNWEKCSMYDFPYYVKVEGVYTIDTEKYKEYQERLTEGLRLFGENLVHVDV